MKAPYDAVIIGGGHNGLVTAAYLARAGKKVLVLERRPVLGGAAVTEEVFPGFRFSVCSYVVSLLRPEIIRELDLPRHGLEILPLDGTFTPMPSGDYLWRMSDHARTRREIYRHSPLDAEAYDEYSKAMADMARFVKPILSMVPPDPLSFDVRGFSRLFAMGRRFQQHCELGPVNLEAIQEYDELEERQRFLEEQNAELIKSKTELLDVINKINETTKELFADTFEQVRKNFQEMFSELFGGGNKPTATHTATTFTLPPPADSEVYSSKMLLVV